MSDCQELVVVRLDTSGVENALEKERETRKELEERVEWLEDQVKQLLRDRDQRTSSSGDNAEASAVLSKRFTEHAKEVQRKTENLYDKFKAIEETANWTRDVQREHGERQKDLREDICKLAEERTELWRQLGIVHDFIGLESGEHETSATNSGTSNPSQSVCQVVKKAEFVELVADIKDVSGRLAANVALTTQTEKRLDSVDVQEAKFEEELVKLNSQVNKMQKNSAHSTNELRIDIAQCKTQLAGTMRKVDDMEILDQFDPQEFKAKILMLRSDMEDGRSVANHLLAAQRTFSQEFDQLMRRSLRGVETAVGAAACPLCKRGIVGGLNAQVVAYPEESRCLSCQQALPKPDPESSEAVSSRGKGHRDHKPRSTRSMKPELELQGMPNDNSRVSPSGESSQPSEGEQLMAMKRQVAQWEVGEPGVLQRRPRPLSAGGANSSRREPSLGLIGRREAINPRGVEAALASETLRNTYGRTVRPRSRPQSAHK